LGGDGDACGAPLLLFLFFIRKYLKARAAELGNPTPGFLLVGGERGEAASNGYNVKPLMASGSILNLGPQGNQSQLEDTRSYLDSWGEFCGTLRTSWYLGCH
jgi:hypothetical protein